ncbi:hypothetical protein [Prauserella aidingensis]|nr:hypothetical protein [Prauserella aidingensis]
MTAVITVVAMAVIGRALVVLVVVGPVARVRVGLVVLPVLGRLG